MVFERIPGNGGIRAVADKASSLALLAVEGDDSSIVLHPVAHCLIQVWVAVRGACFFSEVFFKIDDIAAVDIAGHAVHRAYRLHPQRKIQAHIKPAVFFRMKTDKKRVLARALLALMIDNRVWDAHPPAVFGVQAKAKINIFVICKIEFIKKLPGSKADAPDAFG